MVAKCMFYEEHVVILFSIIVFQLVTDKPRPPGSCELSFAAPSFFLAGRWRESGYDEDRRGSLWARGLGAAVPSHASPSLRPGRFPRAVPVLLGSPLLSRFLSRGHVLLSAPHLRGCSPQS